MIGRAVLVSLGATLLCACGPPTPTGCSSIVPFAGAPSVDLGVVDGAGGAWNEDGMVAMTRGGQGGFMVQPVLSFDPMDLPPGTLPTPPPGRLCAQLEIDNVDPSGMGRFTGFEMTTLLIDFNRNAVTGLYDSPAIQNQLRWTPLAPGTPYRFSAVVRFEDFAGSVTRNVLIR